MIFKYLIPFDSFIIDSPLSVTEARTKLTASMQPKKYFRLFSPDRGDLEGVMTVHGFRINRIPRGRNSFNAQAIGEIDPAPGGCRIRVHTRMLIFVYLFCFAWLTMPVGLVASGWRTISQNLLAGRFQIEDVMPLAMTAFLLVIANIGFWTSSRRLKASLHAVFRAR